MSIDGIKALTFDTGGTILDWHGGFRAALERAGQRHGISIACGRFWTAGCQPMVLTSGA